MYYIPKPSQVCIFITQACNAKCKKCTFRKSERYKNDGLTTEDYKKIILKLKRWLGPYSLFISGGEPTLRDDLPEIIKFASNKGILTNLSTNLLLDDKLKLLKIIDANPDFIIVSLDGANPRTHDESINKKGSFHQVIKNIRLIKKKNPKIRIRIATVIQKNNLNELKNLVRLVHKESLYDIYLQAVIPPGLTNQQNWTTQLCKYSLFPQNNFKIKKSINQIISMKKRGYKINNSVRHLKVIRDFLINSTERIENMECNLYKTLRIGTQGQILLCRGISEPLGNILKDNLNTVWKRECSNILKKSKECNKPCKIIGGNFYEGFFFKLSKFFKEIKS